MSNGAIETVAVNVFGDTKQVYTLPDNWRDDYAEYLYLRQQGMTNAEIFKLQRERNGGQK